MCIMSFMSMLHVCMTHRNLQDTSDVANIHAGLCLQVTVASPEPEPAQAPPEPALEWAAPQRALLEWAAQPPPLSKLPSFKHRRHGLCSCQTTSSWRSAGRHARCFI